MSREASQRVRIGVATGDRAALQLMILIDHILASNIGNDLKDLEEFIKNLPDGTKNSEILAADNVWVPGPPKAEK
jgi:hypothetical protein